MSQTLNPCWKRSLGGKVFELGTQCEETFRTYEDKVLVRINTDKPGLECTGLTGASAGGQGVQEGSINLYGGRKTVHCTQQIASPSDYEFPVTIELEYDYRNLVESSLIVKHSGGI